MGPQDPTHCALTENSFMVRWEQMFNAPLGHMGPCMGAANRSEDHAVEFHPCLSEEEQLSRKHSIFSTQRVLVGADSPFPDFKRKDFVLQNTNRTEVSRRIAD